MKKKYSTAQIFVRIYREILEIVPFSGILGLLSIFLKGLLPAFSTVVLLHIINHVSLYIQGESAASLFIYDGIIFVAVYIAVYGMDFVGEITINMGIFQKCIHNFGIKLAQKTAKLPFIYLEKSDILNMLQRAKDCLKWARMSGIFMGSAQVIVSSISIITLIGVLASYNLWFIPISLVSTVPFFIMVLVRGNEFYRMKYRQAKRNRRLAYLWSLFGNKEAIKEMRVMGFGGYLSGQWIKTRDEINEETWKYNIKEGKSMLFCEVLKIAGYCLSIIFSLFLMLSSHISIGLFGVCIAAFKAMQEASKDLFLYLGMVTTDTAYVSDYFEFLDLEESQTGNDSFAGPISEIWAENIFFSYPAADSSHNTDAVLKGINVSIKQGEKIVILGENGSGKTTLVKVLLGIYESEKGVVLYNRIPLQELDTAFVRQKISVVSQDFVTYNLTLRESIAISNTKELKNDERLNKVIIDAGIQEVIGITGDLDSQMGREFGGAELSGGQSQKVAIARALFRDSEFIILDEPTSALDPLIETEILTQFIKIAREKTAVIISHRVGLCKLADRILVMKDGQIVETGTHDELIQNEGEYKRLYSSQEQWYIN